jgi:hypothetical protein
MQTKKQPSRNCSTVISCFNRLASIKDDLILDLNVPYITVTVLHKTHILLVLPLRVLDAIMSGPSTTGYLPLEPEAIPIFSYDQSNNYLASKWF